MLILGCFEYFIGYYSPFRCFGCCYVICNVDIFGFLFSIKDIHTLVLFIIIADEIEFAVLWYGLLKLPWCMFKIYRSGQRLASAVYSVNHTRPSLKPIEFF